MKCAFVGDIALFGKNTVASENDYHVKFRNVKKFLSDCDYVIGNLETPLTQSKKTIGGKSAYIKGLPSDVEVLSYLGISHVSLANNHMFDFGLKGLLDTISVLDSNNVKWYGAQGKSELIHEGCNSLSLHGFCCYSTNGRGMWDSEAYINVLDPHKVEESLACDKANNCISILSFHFGDEHIPYPRYDHILLARYFAEAYHTIIPCHHPHVIQGLENIGDSVIAYSLGNFCFDNIFTKKSKEPLLALQDSNRTIAVLVLDIENGKIVNQVVKVFYFSDIEYREIDDFYQLNEWSCILKENKEAYEEIRKKELNKYLSQRKTSRNIQWYLKRMSLESIRMVYNSWKNKILYNRLIVNFLKEKSLI